MPDEANFAWTHRTIPLDNIKSKRPLRWDAVAAMNTAILQGAGAHAHRTWRNHRSGQYLIAVPGFLIVHRENHVEVQRNDDNMPADAVYWPEVPFSDVPGWQMEDMLIVYTQMGYC